jgi:hypothetical protein
MHDINQRPSLPSVEDPISQIRPGFIGSEFEQASTDSSKRRLGDEQLLQGHRQLIRISGAEGSKQHDDAKV